MLMLFTMLLLFANVDVVNNFVNVVHQCIFFVFTKLVTYWLYLGELSSFVEEGSYNVGMLETRPLLHGTYKIIIN